MGRSGILGRGPERSYTRCARGPTGARQKPMAQSDTPQSEKPGVVKTRRRIHRNLRDVLRYAKPHWRPIALSIFLMTVQSIANTGRLVLFLPVFTQVLEVDVESKEAASEEERDAKERLETIKREGGPVLRGVEGLVDGVSNLTQGLVSDSWYADEVAKAPEAERAALIEKRRGQFATILSIVLLFVVLIALMCAATYGETYASQYAQLNILMDVREQVIRRLLGQPVSFFDGRTRGELVQRSLGDVGGYASGLNLMFSMVRTFLNLGVPAVTLLLLSPKLCLFMLIAVPFLAPMRKLSMRTLKRAHKRQEQSSKLVQVLLQMFSGVRIVKAFGSEDRRAKEFRETDEEVTRRALRVQRAKSTASAMITFLNNLLALLIVAGGGVLVLTGTVDINPGVMLIFVMLLVTMYQPIKRLVKQFNNLLDAMASIERTTEYLRMESGYRDAAKAGTFAGLRDALRFENVEFEYVEGQPVLKGVSFDIPRGQTVALVGPSGGGKSTICDLVLGFYDPTGGRIAIDDRDLRDFTRASYLERVGLVSQSPFLFHTTIRENIRQGRMQATDADIEGAAQVAFIHEDIAALPDGYDHVVGEEGGKLSGGQRQRITIARALVRDPEVLVLDEATASLDTASEQAVQEALDRLREGRTTLVVAHRLSTIRDADQILVVSGGEIVDRGTHEELIARGGLYADLVRLQDVSSRDA